MKIYYASIYGNTYGDFIDAIYAFTLAEFNGMYIANQNEFHCYATCKTIIDCGDLSKEEILVKLYEKNIVIRKAIIPINELIKYIEQLKNEYDFNICKEEDFEYISLDKFLSKIKPSVGFSIAHVKAGVKSSVNI